MPINELLLTEFEQEMSNTRKTLERVPAERWDWKSHQKSGTLGWMASHVATLPNFTVGVIETSDFEIDGHPSPKVKDASELLKVFADQRQKARDAIASLTDEELHQTWPLYFNVQVWCNSSSVRLAMASRAFCRWSANTLSNSEASFTLGLG